MNYPVGFPGHRDTDGNELTLIGPNPFVREAAEVLKPGSNVLDYGAGYGYNSMYLADLGHFVVSVDINRGYLEDGQKMTAALGATAAKNIVRVQGDLRAPMVRPNFDAVVMTNVLQFIPRSEAMRAVLGMERLTKPNGLHIVSAYIGTPEDQKEKPNLNLYKPGELAAFYSSAGWHIWEHREHLKPLEYGVDENGNSKAYVHSQAYMIARKPTARRARITSYMNGNRQIIRPET